MGFAVKTRKPLLVLVGARGFEPPTTLHPMEHGRELNFPQIQGFANSASN
jgi:hypothetical protein